MSQVPGRASAPDSGPRAGDNGRADAPLGLLFCLDSLGAETLTGIGRYTRGLIEALRGHPAVGELLGFDLRGVRPLADLSQAVGPPLAIGRLRVLASQVKTVVPGAEAARRWMRDRHYRRMLAPHRPCIYHETNFILRPYDGPSITTIHDLSVLRFPGFHPKARVVYFERELPRSLARADLIVTDAALVRQELIDMLGVDPAKVVAVPIGVDRQYRPVPAAARAAVLARHGLADRGYLFCVGTQEPRKNLAALVAAYEALPAALQARFPLVMAGGRGWRNEQFEHRLTALERRGLLQRLGYVPEAELPALYSGARGFAFPSVYEGFGLPPLEALACGTPVLTSRGTSMEEMLGDRALLVDAADPAAITDGLRRLLEDDILAGAAERAAPEIARHFAWSATAGRMVELYRRLAG